MVLHRDFPLQDTWRLITTWGTTPEFNMGLDEALLLGEAQPTLRLYTWSPDALSLGYFQKAEEVLGAMDHRASSTLRRLTGGGAIHHEGELTFSLTCPQSHPLYLGPIGPSYARIHGAVILALREIGLAARLRGDRALASDDPASGMCFNHSTPLDVEWNGRKGVGSAQRRRGGRVLHHGSIKVKSTPLEGNVATFENATLSHTAQSFAPLLLEHIREHLGLHLVPAVPSPEERERAGELGARYTTDEWVNQR